MRSLVYKAFIESRILLLSCSALVTVFTFVYIHIIMTFETAQLKAILDQLKNFEHWLPVEFQQITTYSGRIGLLFEDPTYILCFIGFAISRGSAVVSGEIGRGTMEMLASQPVSRRQIMLSQAFVAVLSLAWLTAAGWLGILLGISTSSITESQQPTVEIPYVNWEFQIPFLKPEEVTVALSDKVDPALFIAPSLNAFCLGVCLYGMTVLISSFDRVRWRTIGVVIAIYLIQVIVKVVGVATKQTALAMCSFLYAYEPQKVLLVVEQDPAGVGDFLAESPTGETVFGPMSNYLVLLAIGTVCFLIALRVFRKRDIPAPV